MYPRPRFDQKRPADFRLSVIFRRESLVHHSDCYEFPQQVEPIGCGRHDEEDEADETDEEDEAEDEDDEDKAGEEDEYDEADEEDEEDEAAEIIN